MTSLGRVISGDKVVVVEPLELLLQVQAELFSNLGLTPTIDVTSTNALSSPCPLKFSTEFGMRVSIANEFIYAHPIPEDVVSVLEY